MNRIALLGAAIALVATACGTGESAPAAESSSTAVTEVPTTSAPVETTTTDVRASGSAQAEPDSDEMTHDVGEGTAHDDVETTIAEQKADGTDRVIEVTMTELEFSPDQLRVTAGETIRFDVTNAGEIVHEFRLSNAHRIEEHIASGHEGHGDDAGGHHADVDVMLELEAGESGEVTVTFPEDTTLFTEVACLIPGHYEGGMKAPINYT